MEIVNILTPKTKAIKSILFAIETIEYRTDMDKVWSDVVDELRDALDNIDEMSK
jgi:hypothetical protein